MTTTEEFKEKIKRFLREKNPYMHDHEIEERITGFWANYRNDKTPDFIKWLRDQNYTLNEKHVQLKNKIVDKTNWAEITKEIIQEFPVYYDKNCLWYLWNDKRKCYEITDETDISIIVDNVCAQNTLKGGIKAEMLESFRRTGRRNKPETIPKTWVQFADKIVNIETGEEIEPTPKYFLTNPIPHNLGATEETPNIDAVLENWSEEYSLTLKQLLAYSILKDYPIHRIFLLIGSGSNGKGTYLRLLNKFIGQENVASVEMDLMISNQFHITKLHNKLCCQMSETNFSALKNTSMLKKLSGGDLIGFEYKNKLPFDDYNHAKIVIATNSLPITHDKTDGFYRRWVIIDFPNQFSEKMDILATITEKEYENLCRWCVGALKEIITKREFHNEGTIQNRKEKYEEKSNPLNTFINEFYDKDNSTTLPAGMFFDHFTSYLQQRGLRTLTYQTVREIMKEEGYEYTRERFALLGHNNAVAAVSGLKRKDEKGGFVSAVSDVSAFSVHSIHMRTKGKVVTQLTQLTQSSDNDIFSVFDRVKSLFSGKYFNNLIPIDVIQRKVPEATDEWIQLKLADGSIYQPRDGWVGLL